MISVLIASYNRNVVNLVNELHSQLIKTKVSFEIICFDDASRSASNINNIEINDVTFREVNTDFLINYKNQFDNVSLDVYVGGNRLNQNASTKQSQTVNLAQPGIYNLNNAASPIEVFQFESQKRINSFYGIAKLGYNGFLFLDITGRNDWSSALATPFSVNGTSFFYPSLSSSFILSNVLSSP